MFGYVTIARPELKIKDEETYRAFYCGLCRALKKRHGLAGLGARRKPRAGCLGLSPQLAVGEARVWVRHGNALRRRHGRSLEPLDYVSHVRFLP